VTAAAKLVAVAEARGFRFRLDGSRVKAKLPEGKPEARALLENLRAHREEIRRLLEQREAAIQVGSRLALFRVGQRVWTPAGPGIVVELHHDRASVQYEDGRRMAWFRGDAMLPMA
jgi:hypothetical protein